MKSEKEKALEIAQLMDDGKGRDVTVIDVSQLNSWTDYFVIVTVNSSVHWKGLYKLVKDYVRDNDMEIHITNKKTSDGDDWNLIDIGTVVVHLMSEGAREFYELEKLWHKVPSASRATLCPGVLPGAAGLTQQALLPGPAGL